MKKYLLIVLLLCSSLYARFIPYLPYVYAVESIVNINGQLYRFQDTLQNDGEYVRTPMLVSVPPSFLTPAYIGEQFVRHNATEYVHKAGYGIYIYVHYPIQTPPDAAIWIWERNEYERKSNLNDRLIKDGYSMSNPNYVVGDEFPQADGSVVIKYYVPDLSSYTKRITIATCPNMGTQTTSSCGYFITDIAGPTPYP